MSLSLKILFAIGTLAPIYSVEKPRQREAANTIMSKQLVFEKLVGIWANENGRSFEQWTKTKNGTYLSKVFSVKGTDTSWREEADVYPEGNNWVFENTVKNQNGGKPIKFISTILNKNVVQFSNPEHDFPTDVNYTIIDANTLRPFIIGPNKKGGKDTIVFNYSRVK